MRINGPYIHSNGRLKGRKYISIVEDDKRTTMLYSRYLMQEKLGRKLSYDETVDHIDNDFTNDDIDNLQILTRSVNAAKWHVANENIVIYEKYICPLCYIEFEKDVRHVKHNRKQGKDGPFCTRSHASKYGRMKQLGQL